MTKAKQKKKEGEREKVSVSLISWNPHIHEKQQLGLAIKCDTRETSSQIKYQTTPNFDLLMVTCSNSIILDLKWHFHQYD